MTRTPTLTIPSRYLTGDLSQWEIAPREGLQRNMTGGGHIAVTKLPQSRGVGICLTPMSPLAQGTSPATALWVMGCAPLTVTGFTREGAGQVGLCPCREGGHFLVTHHAAARSCTPRPSSTPSHGSSTNAPERPCSIRPQRRSSPSVLQRSVEPTAKSGRSRSLWAADERSAKDERRRSPRPRLLPMATK